MIKLSILIPTVVSREAKLESLMNAIRPQLTDEVEVFTLCDNKEITIGEKRTALYQESKGLFAVQIDDDDMIPDYYVSEVLKRIDSFPDIDCIGYIERCIWGGSRETFSDFSLRYSEWKEQKDNPEFAHVRTPFHKTPIRTEIAKQVTFDAIRWGEDHKWSIAVNPLLKTEVYIPKVMYIYQYEHENPKTKYGIK